MYGTLTSTARARLLRPILKSQVFKRVEEGVFLKCPPDGERTTLMIFPAQTLGAVPDAGAQRDDLLNVSLCARSPLHVNDGGRLEARVGDEAVYAVAQSGERVSHLLLVVFGLSVFACAAFGRAESEVVLHPDSTLPDLCGLPGDAGVVERAAGDDGSRNFVAYDLYALEVLAELFGRRPNRALVRARALALADVP